MDAINFVYWMQGFLELGDIKKGMTPEQIQIVKDHIALVLHKVTPDRILHPKSNEQFPSVESNPLDSTFLNRDDLLCVNIQAPVETPVRQEESLKELSEQDQQKVSITARHAAFYPDPRARYRGARYC